MSYYQRDIRLKSVVASAIKKYPAIKPDKTLTNHQTSYRLLDGVYGDLLDENQAYVSKGYS